ncbi:hypothetical protein, partial [Sansalvadorimonas verongulae]|uniref:hypothetical protein n=1 Tax=Sansalvadorimonas verongulae TaxID=2172824 RepID=UPI001E4CB604
VETDATTWVKTPSNLCRISSNSEAPDILYAPPSPPPLDSLFPELAGLVQDDSDQLPTNISGMRTLRARTGGRPFVCD